MDSLTFSISAMHAYGHQWACQLIYNPRFREGVGLTDGEGVERLWSRMRKLVGLERSSGVSLLFFGQVSVTEGTTKRTRRLWLLDRQASAIGQELRDDLGYWIQRRYRLGVNASTNAAQCTLDECGVDVAELRQQWASQRAAQLSIRAHMSNL